ncbi:MAG: crossover junction endodeoxyribonuclease RuvC [Pseudomonadota bacterium]
MAKRILGIDPGSRTTGYGVIEISATQTRYIASGAIKVGHQHFVSRLGEIFLNITQLIEDYQPTEFAIEEVFLARNPQSALKLGQARGAAVAAAVAAGLPVAEYAARQIKLAIVGSGRANKQQVQHMVQVLLELSGVPQADAADALAIALCHVNTQQGELKTRQRTHRKVTLNTNQGIHRAKL